MHFSIGQSQQNSAVLFGHSRRKRPARCTCSFVSTSRDKILRFHPHPSVATKSKSKKLTICVIHGCISVNDKAEKVCVSSRGGLQTISPTLGNHLANAHRLPWRMRKWQTYPKSIAHADVAITGYHNKANRHDDTEYYGHLWSDLGQLLSATPPTDAWANSICKFLVGLW